MSNAYDYQEDPELAGKFVTMGEGAAVDRYGDEPTARIVVRPPSVRAPARAGRHPHVGRSGPHGRDR